MAAVLNFREQIFSRTFQLLVHENDLIKLQNKKKNLITLRPLFQCFHFPFKLFYLKKNL